MARLPALPPRGLPLEITRHYVGRPIYDRPRLMRIASEPQPGYFKTRLVRRGVWVPAIIWLPCPLILPEPLDQTPGPEDWCCPTERPRLLRARIGHDEADPYDVWVRGSDITAAEYAWRLARGDWAKRFAPAQPEANPKKPANLAQLPSLF
jgi:hypothetical protein